MSAQDKIVDCQQLRMQVSQSCSHMRTQICADICWHMTKNAHMRTEHGDATAGRDSFVSASWDPVFDITNKHVTQIL